MKGLKIAGVILAIPLALGVLGLDIILGFGFGTWCAGTWGTNGTATESSEDLGFGFLGFMAFVLLLGAEIGAGFLIWGIMEEGV